MNLKLQDNRKYTSEGISDAEELACLPLPELSDL